MQPPAPETRRRAASSPIRALSTTGPRAGGTGSRDEDAGPAERLAVMRSANPAFIPRNHLVEEAIDAAQDKGDFAPFETLLAVLAKPYEDRPAFARYAAAPRPDQIIHQTFCGT